MPPRQHAKKASLFFLFCEAFCPCPSFSCVFGRLPRKVPAPTQLWHRPLRSRRPAPLIWRLLLRIRFCLRMPPRQHAKKASLFFLFCEAFCPCPSFSCVFGRLPRKVPAPTQLWHRPLRSRRPAPLIWRLLLRIRFCLRMPPRQ